MVNNGPLSRRPWPWLSDNWQLTPGNCFSKNASAEDTTARASRPNLSLAAFSHHTLHAMEEPAKREAKDVFVRQGLVTDPGWRGRRLCFRLRKASLGTPLPGEKENPRQKFCANLVFSALQR